MQKIAVFGGAFDPVHWGHLLIAETARDQAKLDGILWVPTFRPPHKNQALSSFAHRCEMVQQAIADHPAFQLSTIEQREGVSYAIATLAALQVQYPNTEWYWIIGTDAFQTLPGWKSAPELVAVCSWLVAPRQMDGALERCQKTVDRFLELSITLRWQLLEMPCVGVSSSLIRDRCRQGKSIRYFVPSAVETAIASYHLYK